MVDSTASHWWRLVSWANMCNASPNHRKATKTEPTRLILENLQQTWVFNCYCTFVKICTYSTVIIKNKSHGGLLARSYPNPQIQVCLDLFLFSNTTQRSVENGHTPGLHSVFQKLMRTQHYSQLRFLTNDWKPMWKVMSLCPPFSKLPIRQLILATQISTPGFLLLQNGWRQLFLS